MSFVRAVWSAMTWRKVLIMLTVGAAMPLARVIVGAQTLAVPLAVAIGFSAVANLLVALGADEIAKRGVRLRRVYPIGIVSVLLINCTIAELTRRTQWHPDLQIDSHTLPAALQWTVVLRYGLDQSLWGVFALFVYLNRRIAQRMLQRVRETELGRVRLESQLVESRLAAAHAQVDPQLLFGALAAVRAQLNAAAPDASEQLDLLIHQLRSALARTATIGESGTDRL